MQQRRDTSPNDLEQVRRAVLLDGIDVRAQRGVEFGPLDCPIVAKSEGRILYIDYTTADELRAKHGHRPGKDPAAIVEVDRVWNGVLPTVLRDDLPLDYALASHVIEHVPDLVGWLDEVAHVLRPGGRLCLAVPDKRYTFDRRRETSDLSAAMSAHLQGLRRPCPRQVFDHHYKVVQLPLREAWQGCIDPAGLSRIHDFGYALSQAQKARDGEYVDCHCWVFTPFSFLELMAELVGHGLTPYRLAAFHETRPNTFEFYACLECDPAILNDPGRRGHAAESFRSRIPWYGAGEQAQPTNQDLLVLLQAMGRRFAAAEGQACEIRDSLDRANAELKAMRRVLNPAEPRTGGGFGWPSPWLRRLAGRMRSRSG